MACLRKGELLENMNVTIHNEQISIPLLDSICVRV